MKRTWMATPEARAAGSGDIAAESGLPGKRRTPRIVIGRREWVALPELGVSPVNAKVDTGARSSSLHAEEIAVFQRDGETWVKFSTHDHYGHSVPCEARLTRRKAVKSSTGIARERLFIETTMMTAGGLTRRIEISLADRSDMKCPMLLGRTALSGYFLVDPQSSHLLGGARDLTAYLSDRSSR